MLKLKKVGKVKNCFIFQKFLTKSGSESQKSNDILIDMNKWKRLEKWHFSSSHFRVNEILGKISKSFPFFFSYYNKKGHTLREEIFAGINFREFFFSDISRELIFANWALLGIRGNQFSRIKLKKGFRGNQFSRINLNKGFSGSKFKLPLVMFFHDLSLWF